MVAGDTQKYYKKYSAPVGYIYGAIGGLVSVWVMTPFLMIAMAMLGLHQNALFVAVGEYVDSEAALQVGFALHLATGVVIGAAFGTATAFIGRFRIISFSRAVVGGLGTGIVAFVIVFLPLSLVVLPSFAQQMVENGDLSEEVVIDQLEERFPALLVLSLINHLLYGIILGIVMAAFVVGVKKAPSGTRAG